MEGSDAAMRKSAFAEAEASAMEMMKSDMLKALVKFAEIGTQESVSLVRQGGCRESGARQKLIVIMG